MQYKVLELKPFGVLITPEEKSVGICDVDIDELKGLFKIHQLVILRGFTPFTNAEDFSQYCECWGEISLWPFGKVLELIEQDSPQDHIFDNSYVPMHWDGMYRPQVPEYQIFHCVKAPLKDHGGRTTFSNTLLALENASSELKSFWKRATGIYQRKMAFYHSKTTSPILTKHPSQDFEVIRYNEPPCSTKGEFINPPMIEFVGIKHEELEFLHQSMKEALYDPQNLYAHEWQVGDVVIADNFTLLHGREAFVENSPRHLQRVQVLSHPPFANPNLESF